MTSNKVFNPWVRGVRGLRIDIVMASLKDCTTSLCHFQPILKQMGGTLRSGIVMTILIDQVYRRLTNLTFKTFVVCVTSDNFFNPWVEGVGVYYKLVSFPTNF